MNREPRIRYIILISVHLLLKVFLVLFTLFAVFISLKTAVIHRVEGASLRAVLLLRIAWWYWFLLNCGLLLYQAEIIDH
jgi:hypothetical protein